MAPCRLTGAGAALLDPFVDINQHTSLLTPKDEAASKGGVGGGGIDR